MESMGGNGAAGRRKKRMFRDFIYSITYDKVNNAKVGYLYKKNLAMKIYKCML